MAELPAMQVLYGSVKFLEAIEALCGDAGLYDATVIGLACAADQAAFFHTVEEAGHVGVARNHAITDALAGQAKRLGSAEDAQDIVLSAGELVLLHELLGLLAEMVRSFEKRDEDAGFEGRGGSLSRLEWHGHKDSCYNDCCQEVKITDERLTW